MKLMRLTKVTSSGGEIPVFVSRLHVEYIEAGAGELTVVRTSSAYLFVKETLDEVLNKMES